MRAGFAGLYRTRRWLVVLFFGPAQEKGARRLLPRRSRVPKAESSLLGADYRVRANDASRAGVIS